VPGPGSRQVAFQVTDLLLNKAYRVALLTESKLPDLQDPSKAPEKPVFLQVGPSGGQTRSPEQKLLGCVPQ
jgi:hypothetical protein